MGLLSRGGERTLVVARGTDGARRRSVLVLSPCPELTQLHLSSPDHDRDHNRTPRLQYGYVPFRMMTPSNYQPVRVLMHICASLPQLLPARQTTDGPRPYG